MQLEFFQSFQMLDCFSNKVYEWVGRIGMRSCAILNSIFTRTCLQMFYKSWINWILNFNMIWLISQLLVEPSITLFQFYCVILYPWMDLCLVVQAKKWGSSWGNLRESSADLWNQYMRSYYSCNGNWWAQWSIIMHIIGCILCAKSFLCFEWLFPRPSSIQCSQIFLALVIIQAMIVTKS